MVTVNGTTGVSMVQDDAVNPVTDIASGLPCFSAYQSVAQSISAATSTKLNFQTKEFDTTNAYDITTMRFTPQVAGYYHINICATFNGGNSMVTSLSLRKNGSLFKVFNEIVNAAYSHCGSCIVYCNGSTDFIEAYGYSSLATTIGASSFSTYFQAHLIVGA